jgi:nicotinic acid phosphoribosyltransferase
MTISLNGRLDEQVSQIQAAADLLLTTTVGDTKYVSLKGYRKIQIVIDIANGTAVTGSTITIKQATAVAGTGEKALAFTRMLANIDVAAAQTMVETAVSNNTFVTDTTNSKNLRYVIDVDADSLDVAGGFDCIRLDGTGHAATASRGVCVTYILYGARYSGASPVAD